MARSLVVCTSDLACADSKTSCSAPSPCRQLCPLAHTAPGCVWPGTVRRLVQRPWTWHLWRSSRVRLPRTRPCSVVLSRVVAQRRFAQRRCAAALRAWKNNDRLRSCRDCDEDDAEKYMRALVLRMSRDAGQARSTQILDSDRRLLAGIACEGELGLSGHRCAILCPRGAVLAVLGVSEQVSRIVVESSQSTSVMRDEALLSMIPRCPWSGRATAEAQMKMLVIAPSLSVRHA